MWYIYLFIVQRAPAPKYYKAHLKSWRMLCALFSQYCIGYVKMKKPNPLKHVNIIKKLLHFYFLPSGRMGLLTYNSTPFTRFANIYEAFIELAILISYFLAYVSFLFSVGVRVICLSESFFSSNQHEIILVQHVFLTQ